MAGGHNAMQRKLRETSVRRMRDGFSVLKSAEKYLSQEPAPLKAS